MIVKIIRDPEAFAKEDMTQILAPVITEKDRTDFFNGPIYDELQREHDHYTMLFIPPDEEGPWDEPDFENELNKGLNEGDLLGFAAILDGATATSRLSAAESIVQTTLVFNKGKNRNDPIGSMSEGSLDLTMKEAYQKIDDHYAYLVELIRKENQEAGPFLSNVPFVRRLDHLIPTLEFLVQGAKDEKDPLKIETLQKMQDMLVSLRVLAKHQNCYSEAYFEKRWTEFAQLLEKQNVNKETQQKLKGGLEEVVKKDLFQKGDEKKFIEFDLSKTIELKSPQELSKKMNVKIEYDSNTSLMKVQFGYDRAKLLSIKNNSRFTGSPVEELKKFHSQISDFVSVALSECNKGSKDNPIHIQYPDPDRPQPEAALGVLMEMKKRALLDGKIFYATDHDGKMIEITPEKMLSQEEKEYFMHFANERSSVKNKEGKVTEGKYTIGYQLLRRSDPALEKGANEDQILSSIEKSINDKTCEARSERLKRISGFVQGQETKASMRPS